MISKITLLDTVLNIQGSDQDIETLKEATLLFEQYINEAKAKMKTSDRQIIALIAGLNMARELGKSSDGKQQLERLSTLR